MSIGANWNVCGHCGHWYAPGSPHLCATIDSIKGGEVSDSPYSVCPNCGGAWSDPAAFRRHRCSTRLARIARLEAVVDAARSWDQSGRWQDGQKLHEAIKALEHADA